MFPRSLALFAALAVFASSPLQPSASAGTDPGPAASPTALGVALPSLPPPPSKTAWQARIDGRLAALSDRPLRVPASGEASPSLVASLQRLAASMEDEAAVGIAVKDLRTGAAVFEHHGEQPLNPASNHKLLTATAAVTLLGDDYRFRTSVLRRGGTVFLRGGGDPSLQVGDVQTLAAEVAPEDIERIVVDDSMFTDRVFGPGYDRGGPGYSYMAPSGALSLQYNTVVVKVRPDRSPDGVGVTLDPPCPHLVVERGRARGTLQVTTHARADETVIRVDGRPRRTTAIRRRITDPGRFTASVFAEALGRPELPITRGHVPAGAEEIATHASAPLPEVLGSALKFSNNFTTEQVMRTLGYHASDAPGDWDNGAEVLLAFWDAAGRDRAALTFENASGLSRRGRVTPHALVELVSLWAHDDRAEAVLAALPIAGREGTLRGRLRHSHGRVRAKTGTLHDATGLTGVVTDEAGEPRYAFSVLVGTERIGRAKRFQDRVVMALLQRG